MAILHFFSPIKPTCMLSLGSKNSHSHLMPCLDAGGQNHLENCFWLIWKQSQALNSVPRPVFAQLLKQLAPKEFHSHETCVRCESVLSLWCDSHLTPEGGRLLFPGCWETCVLVDSFWLLYSGDDVSGDKSSKSKWCGYYGYLALCYSTTRVYIRYICVCAYLQGEKRKRKSKAQIPFDISIHTPTGIV